MRVRVCVSRPMHNLESNRFLGRWGPSFVCRRLVSGPPMTPPLFSRLHVSNRPPPAAGALWQGASLKSGSRRARERREEQTTQHPPTPATTRKRRTYINMDVAGRIDQPLESLDHTFGVGPFFFVSFSLDCVGVVRGGQPVSEHHNTNGRKKKQNKHTVSFWLSPRSRSHLQKKHKHRPPVPIYLVEHFCPRPPPPHSIRYAQARVCIVCVSALSPITAPHCTQPPVSLFFSTQDPITGCGSCAVFRTTGR